MDSSHGSDLSVPSPLEFLFEDSYPTFPIHDAAQADVSQQKEKQFRWRDDVGALRSNQLNITLPLSSISQREPVLERNLKLFACPVFQGETARGQPHSCNGVAVTSMSEVRRHLVRGRKPHLEFLKLCPTCNDQFIDKHEYESLHGEHGELCHNVRKQVRGKASETQWMDLYKKIYPLEPDIPVSSYATHKCQEARCLSKHTTQAEPDNAVDHYPFFHQGAGSLRKHVVVTPYQHIVDSESEAETDVTTPSLTPGSQPSLTPGSQFDLCVPTDLSQLDFVAARKEAAQCVAAQNGPDRLGSSTNTSCPLCNKTFQGEYARGNLTRHKKRHSAPDLPCEVEGCNKKYHRSDARINHYRKSHPELNVTPTPSQTYERRMRLEQERKRQTT